MKAARIQDRDTIASQNQQLSEYEAEISVLRRRIEQLENDRERDKREIARLTEALNRARVVSLNNYIHFKVWNEITYPFPNFNGASYPISSLKRPNYSLK